MDNFAIIRSVGGYAQEALFNRELSSILSSFRGLRAVSSSYITNLGEELVMVALEGTFPILFRGSTYNIPAELYFPKEFPEVPPIVFIRPTASLTFVLTGFQGDGGIKTVIKREKRLPLPGKDKGRGWKGPGTPSF